MGTKVILFGGTGMVGQGVLRECLLDPEIERVLSIGRSPIGKQEPKLIELVHGDLASLEPIADQLAGYDACLFCLGVTSAGMSEAAYTKVTYDLTLSIARTLLSKNPDMTFIYVSGSGTDSTEKGRTMWARVKGKTENALLGLGFKKAFMFRPGYIQPEHGVKSKTALYSAVYAVMAPFYPVLKKLLPKYVTRSEHVSKVMLLVAKHGTDKSILENADINRLALA